MLTPEYLLHVSENAEEIASMLERYITNAIIKRIIRRLDRGDNYILTSVDKWQIEAYQDAGLLRTDLVSEIAYCTGLQAQEIERAMNEAAVKTISYESKTYENIGIDTTTINKSPYVARLIARNTKAMMSEWNNLTQTRADTAQQLFIKECDKAYNLVATGAISTTQAVKEAINTIAKKGTSVTYTKLNDDGNISQHKDTIETATLRAVRTGIGQASAEIVLERMRETGHDIVLVSAHLGARNKGGIPENHELWQGQFYSLSGKDTRFRPFYEYTGYGTGEGLCGYNCRHSIGIGDGENNPYEHIDTEENRRVYELSQKQRALERTLRKTKREVQAWETAVNEALTDETRAGSNKIYERKAALLQKQNKRYEDFCKENGLQKLSDRTYIANWDRSSATKATAAAKRYNKQRSN